MSDDFTVPPGGSLDITLKRKRPDTKRPAPQESSGIVGLDDESTRYVRRGGKLVLQFFDLGTRLRTPPAGPFTATRTRSTDATDTPQRDEEASLFNEYVEIGWGFALSDSDDDLTEEQAHEVDRWLLGSRFPADPAPPDDPLDPLGHTPANGSGRSLAHCEPIQYDTQSLLLNLRVADKNYLWGLRREDLSEEQAEGYVWKKRKPESADEGERWNSLNLATGAALESGYLEIDKGAALDSLALSDTESFYKLFEPFDTADAVNYKVTSEPLLASEEVELGLEKSGGPVSIYLKPRPARFTIGHFTAPGDFVEDSFWGGRLGLYPAPFGGDRFFLFGGYSCFVERYSEVVGLPSAGHIQFIMRASQAHAGTLAAIIKQAERVFYVWKLTAADSSPQPTTATGGFEDDSIGACGA